MYRNRVLLSRAVHCIANILCIFTSAPLKYMSIGVFSIRSLSNVVR
uniref:Uncharacterized protein n=1 Tax=Anguilla anguilla TaxID=7936 RepID=A0A0E9P7V4_ANGAN